jgi:hypothetical protein
VLGAVPVRRLATILDLRRVLNMVCANVPVSQVADRLLPWSIQRLHREW